MKRRKLRVLLVGAGLLMPAFSLLAHHSFTAEFDAGNPVELKGVITKLEWANPHSRVYVDVKDANGNVTNWTVELLSPNALMRTAGPRIL